jgi:hypothetical protein
MVTFRRFLVLQFLMLWQGGFLFYASVVVPTGTEVLGGSFEQARITRLVTPKLNGIGIVALAVFAWEIAAAAPKSRRQRRILRVTWIVMAAGLLALLLLHPRLAERVNFETSKIADRGEFQVLHRVYLWVSTLQWLAAFTFAIVLVASWKSIDRLAPVNSPLP